MGLGRILVRLEKAWARLMRVDFSDKEKLLAASREVDELVLEYYRAKLGPKAVVSIK